MEHDLIITFKKGKKVTYKKEEYFEYSYAGSYLILSRRLKADMVETIYRTVIPLSDIAEIMEIKRDDGVA